MSGHSQLTSYISYHHNYQTIYIAIQGSYRHCHINIVSVISFRLQWVNQYYSSLYPTESCTLCCLAAWDLVYMHGQVIHSLGYDYYHILPKWYLKWYNYNKKWNVVLQHLYNIHSRTRYGCANLWLHTNGFQHVPIHMRRLCCTSFLCEDFSGKFCKSWCFRILTDDPHGQSNWVNIPEKPNQWPAKHQH